MNKIITFNHNQNHQSQTASVLNYQPSPELSPEVEGTAEVHSLAAVIGNVYLGERVMVAPGASIRGERERLVWVSQEVQIRDGVIVQGVDTGHHQELMGEPVVEVNGHYYGVYIDRGVTLAHQCQICGPASIGAETYVGMQSLIFRATVGSNCVVEPKALVMGVNIADDRYVPAGALITTQAAADDLPGISPRYSSRRQQPMVAQGRKFNAKVISSQSQVA
ncbi:hypothetical protein [Pleurocapsa sp. PCC 7319]|uniref:hypothetical protein n=1 Tax=Pleurocapsa sp. PCC 7319 TaxID=118161 RepID=UPI00034987AD|nr:hypothetical protein [Pleurocapsa sp. PCC 7319]